MKWLKQLFCRHKKEAYIMQHSHQNSVASYKIMVYHCPDCDRYRREKVSWDGGYNRPSKRKPRKRKSPKYTFMGSSRKRQRKEDMKIHWKRGLKGWI